MVGGRGDNHGTWHVDRRKHKFRRIIKKQWKHEAVVLHVQTAECRTDRSSGFAIDLWLI